MNLKDTDIQEENQFEELIQGLIDNKYGTCNDFLSPNTSKGLRSNMEALNLSGEMNYAGVGNKINFQKNKLIRSDKVNWIEEQSTNPYEEIYLSKILRFINHLNKTCYTSIKNFESHYSSYEKGTYYKRHLDQFKNENSRKYSVVLYLNESWQEKDGGNLSLYPTNGKQKNISPLEGRMVFFKSDEMEHEVHSSLTKERKSIAGWLKN